MVRDKKEQKSKIYIVKPPTWMISQIVFPANIHFPPLKDGLLLQKKFCGGAFA
jgi:hypothetical protein